MTALIGPVADVTGRALGTTGEIRSLIDSPIAPRGGVMMVPLASENDDARWPARLSLRLADGRSIEGHVGWLHPRTASFHQSPQSEHGTRTEAGRTRADMNHSSYVGAWTADPRRLAIRAVRPEDRAGESGTPVLLARLPEDGAGPITLSRRRIEPIWRDRATSSRPRNDRPMLARTPALDRPDPDSPFEHWRWVLLAQQLNLEPPPFPSQRGQSDDDRTLNAMLAEHLTDLWMIGLERLESKSPGLAQHARELLTRICADGDVAFAAWVADPAQTNGLLANLLNVRRSGEALLGDVLAWTEKHERIRLWIDSDAGDRVRFSIINPDARPVIVRFDWAEVNEPPLAIEIPPGTLRRVSVDRPVIEPRVARRMDRLQLGVEPPARPDVLKVTSGGQTLTIPLGARAAQAGPPGFWLPVLRPPLTLAEVQGLPPAPVSSEHAAIAHVRRLSGRWEVFFENRRPSAPSTETRSAPQGEGSRPTPTSIDEARGVEAVVLTLGDADDPQRIVLIVPEHGWHHLSRGESDGTLRVHRRSYDDHWVCRIVLPDSWLRAHPGERTFISVMRTRAGSPMIDFSPRPTTPWRTEADPIALDLSEWLDLP